MNEDGWRRRLNETLVARVASRDNDNVNFYEAFSGKMFLIKISSSFKSL